MTTAKVIPIKNAAPTHLSAEARGWWERICTEYEISDEGGRLLLLMAMEAFDRMRGCQKAIAEDGLVTRGSKKQPRAHPLLSAERDSRAQMLAALKALNLDLEPLRDLRRKP